MTDVWYALRDHERYVYHYTRAETLIDYILPTDKIRLSRFEGVNDPRESKEWTFSFSHYGDDIGATIDDVRTIFDRELRRTWRLGCFTMDSPDAALNSAGSNALSVLWLRGHSRPRMWTQYGDNYRGVCLAFDKKRLDAAIRNAAGASAPVHCEKVVYEIDPFTSNPLSPANPHLVDSNAVRALGAQQAAAAHIAKHFRRLYFRKTLDWSTEQEFRWAVSSNLVDEFYVTINDSIAGVLLGDKFPKSLQKSVGEYSLKHNVSVAKMDWRNNGVPQVQMLHGQQLIS